MRKLKERISNKTAFKAGHVDNIPFENERFEIVVSGLTLNFFPNLESAFSEMKRVITPDGVIAAYVWDYAGRMDFLRYFWDAAYQLDSKSKTHDEGIRFPVCNSNQLSIVFQEAGMVEIETSDLDINTVFTNFEDYWNPFLGGQGPAPSYLASLSEKLQNDLKDHLRNRLHCEYDGSIKLLGRAIAIKGKLK